MPTEKEPATKPNEVMITLTQEQQEQIKKQTGQLIKVLKLTPQELEERASTYLDELISSRLLTQGGRWGSQPKPKRATRRISAWCSPRTSRRAFRHMSPSDCGKRPLGW